LTTPDPSRAPLDLRRQRDIGGLIADGFGIYFRNFGTFLAIAAAVVVPVHLIVAGIGLGELTSGYDDSPGVAEQVIPVLAAAFVIAPLTTAMCIYAMLDLADGKQPRIGPTIQRGLDVFAPLLVAMLMYAGAVVLGLIAFIIPGIYVLIRLGFVIQATVVDGRRGADALRRSWDLISGWRMWVRVFAVTLAVNFLVGGLSALIGLPFLAASESSDSAVFQLIGTIIGGVLFAAPAALISSLLYFDVRTRAGD
jgi:hypothetical protein